MGGYKPVDTAIVMVVGPCIDSTDFKSLEESIAYDAAGMDISLIVEKTDGTTATTAITLTTGGTSDWTHKDGGYYEVEVTAAQNAEEGIAYVRGVCTGVLPFESAHHDIVKANIYDSWVKGTDVLQTDVTQWLGTAAATPTVAGVPEIDITHLGGVAQSATDLKDFADAGYNPDTHYLLGVTTCTTTSTNTDMVGTDSAALASGVDVTSIHGSALTETVGGYLAAAFTKLFDVATPTLVASDVMRGTDGVSLVVPDAAGVAPTAAEINDEVADVLKTDTTSEMAQGAPPATPTFEEMLAYVYFRLRNKCETTATEDAVYNNAGNSKLFKATIGDDGTTFTKATYTTGA